MCLEGPPSVYKAAAEALEFLQLKVVEAARIFWQSTHSSLTLSPWHLLLNLDRDRVLEGHLAWISTAILTFLVLGYSGLQQGSAASFLHPLCMPAVI